VTGPHGVLTLVTVLLCGVGPPAQAAPRRPLLISGVLNLNQATLEQLELLPGVGEKAAQSILAFREKRGFRRIEELVQVRGFGRKRFEKLKLHLVVSGPTTLRAQRTGASQPGAG
jgi:competence protein ComEA